MKQKKHILIYGLPSGKIFDVLKKEKVKSVFVAELRPHLKGAQQLTKKLLAHKIKPVLICDNMMAFCMWRGLVSKVIVSGEKSQEKSLTCPTGTLVAAICAQHHKIPVEAFPIEKGWDNLTDEELDIRRIAGHLITSNMQTYVPFKEQVPLHYVRNVYDE